MKLLLQVLSIVLLCAFATPSIEAQNTARKAMHQGERAFKKNRPEEAETAYRKALALDSTYQIARYNLGNALYQQNKHKEAFEAYRGVTPEMLQNVDEAAALFHNMGNALMGQKEYAQAIEYYKQSLRLNPSDDETRYNLALALKLLPPDQKQPQGGGSAPQPNPQSEPNPKPKESPEPPQQTPPNDALLDKNRAENLLDAFSQDEEKSRQRYEERRQAQERKSQPKDKKRW